MSVTTQLAAPRAVSFSVPFPIVLVVLGLAIRLPLLGNPVAMADEQFYLLVADRMAHGVMPYVGIWDRKPIGLFLIYRLALALPGDPIVAYQLLGLAASVATALVIERIARPIAPPAGAVAAALAYLLFQPVFSAACGQSPVFYNLPVALAALLVARAAADASGASLARRGAAAMALIGVALQIKYTVVFEGVALGLILLAAPGLRHAGRARLASLAAGWAAIALAPTLLAWAAYAFAGHGAAFAQANFLSIFARGQSDGEQWGRFAGAVALLAPLVALVALSWRATRAPEALPLRWWAGAAIVGYLAFGTWYDHYAAPLLAPLCVLAAPALASRRWAAPALLGIGAIAGTAVSLVHVAKAGDAAQFAEASALIDRNLRGGCLYVFQGPPGLYRATGACIPTRFAFPAHLGTSLETRALGTDPGAEERRIMDSQPAVVVTQDRGEVYMPNPASAAIVANALRRDYTRIAVTEVGRERLALWRLRDAPEPRPTENRARDQLAILAAARR